MPQNFDPISALKRGDLVRPRRYQDIELPRDTYVPDDRQFTSDVNVTDPADSTPEDAFPKVPATPALFRSPTAPAAPSTVGQLRMEADVTPNVKPSPWHFTSPEEHQQLEQTRQDANTYPALAGLQANQPRFPQAREGSTSFMGQTLTGTSRNQAMVDRMRADLGMAPEGLGDASVSQANLEAEHGPHEAFAHMIEQMKAQAPVSAAQAAAHGQLAVKQAELQGQREFEQQGYQQLQDLLDQNKLAAGTTLSTPRGFTVRTSAPSQMLPAGVGAPAQKELDDARKQLAALPVGGVAGQFEELKGVVSGKSLSQRRQELQQKISDLERQLGVPPASGAVPQGSIPPTASQGGQWISLPSGGRVYREQ